MESNDKLEEVGIKNFTFYHFDDIMTFRGFNFSDVLLDKKSNEKTLIFDISYKTFADAKPLGI